MSSSTLCVTYLDNFFSSMPFLCSVAIKSVNALDILNCNSIMRPAKISGPYKKPKEKLLIYVTWEEKMENSLKKVYLYLMCNWYKSE